MRRLALLLVVSFVSSANAIVEWDYWSPLTVVESITDIGNGDYRYEYSFTNVDTGPIFLFIVYSNFETQGESSFTSYSSWSEPLFAHIELVASAYDVRNLDPDIVGLTGTHNCRDEVWGTICPSDTAIQLGEYASGLSLIASVYDPSPKYYLYRAHGPNGDVYAVGLTVPEPATLFILSLGGFTLLKKRKLMAI